VLPIKYRVLRSYNPSTNKKENERKEWGEREREIWVE
jgi:hypothetical protein